jgi:hypothetical protein
MAPPTRLVRRTTLAERIRSNLNISDLLLWASEELNSQDWEEFDKQWSTLIGTGMNALFILVRIYSVAPSDGHDVFEDYSGKSGGLTAWLVSVARFFVSFTDFCSALSFQ